MVDTHTSTHRNKHLNTFSPTHAIAFAVLKKDHTLKSCFMSSKAFAVISRYHSCHFSATMCSLVSFHFFNIYHLVTIAVFTKVLFHEYFHERYGSYFIFKVLGVLVKLFY